MIQKNHKILIAEDETSLRAALRNAFELNGFEVLEARNGEEGLAIALREHPEAILLDVFMPKMNGIAMARELRLDTWGKNVPIIILTNTDDMKNIEQAMENDVFQYYLKSDTKIKDIVEKVSQLVK